MDYSQTLEFLYSQLPMYQRVGAKAFKKGLGNTRKLLKAVGDPHKSYPSVHVAGTNGKGTVCHMLAAAYQSAGLKVGLYTSPHYADFRERFKVNGKMIPKKSVSAFVSANQSIIEIVKPSFFEITVAMAFAFFRDEEVDIAIIETGLGGRLDSTNVVQPILSVITNISFDHMDMLGNTITSIAREKAGIIKKGTPVVVGQWQKEASAVFKTVAHKKKASLSYASRNVKCTTLRERLEHSDFLVGCKSLPEIRNLRVEGGGPFLSYNVRTALWAIATNNNNLDDLKLSARVIRKAFRSYRTITNHIGRWQVLSTTPLILADSAHNEAALNAVMKRIESVEAEHLHMVVGFVEEKELAKFLHLFPRHASYYFCKPDVPRGLDANELVTIAAGYGLLGKKYQSVRTAVNAARRKAGLKDLIFIGGSSFVVAEVVNMRFK